LPQITAYAREQLCRTHTRYACPGVIRCRLGWFGYERPLVKVHRKVIFRPFQTSFRVARYASQKAPTSRRCRRRMRILLVEDDEKMARLLRRGLEEERHAVHVADDGAEGLRLSRTYAFDVIILDVMLPG